MRGALSYAHLRCCLLLNPTGLLLWRRPHLLLDHNGSWASALSPAAVLPHHLISNSHLLPNVSSPLQSENTFCGLSARHSRHVSKKEHTHFLVKCASLSELDTAPPAMHHLSSTTIYSVPRVRTRVIPGSRSLPQASLLFPCFEGSPLTLHYSTYEPPKSNYCSSSRGTVCFSMCFLNLIWWLAPMEMVVPTPHRVLVSKAQLMSPSPRPRPHLLAFST